MKQYRINKSKPQAYRCQVKHSWFPMWVSCRSLEDLKGVISNILGSKVG